MRSDPLRERMSHRADGTLARRPDLYRADLYRAKGASRVSPRSPVLTRLSVLTISATLTALLLAAAVGCSPRKPERDPVRPAHPIVAESYAIDDENRPLQESEIEEAFLRLEADAGAFIAELEKAPPVRQASLIFVLQRKPSLAREHRDLLEKLSASEHGIVRRAALFALEAADEGK